MHLFAGVMNVVRTTWDVLGSINHNCVFIRSIGLSQQGKYAICIWVHLIGLYAACDFSQAEGVFMWWRFISCAAGIIVAGGRRILLNIYSRDNNTYKYKTTCSLNKLRTQV